MSETTINLDEMAQAMQRQVMYPQLGINIESHGAMLVILLGPATTITQGITPDAMDDICAKWQNRHKDGI